jgi:nicotinamidase-related amidase
MAECDRHASSKCTWATDEKFASSLLGFLYGRYPMTSSNLQNLSFPSRRSPGLLGNQRSALCVIDVQEKLLPVVDREGVLVRRVAKLIAAANELQVGCVATEQYPEKLGPTVAELRGNLSTILAKRMFSVRECFSGLEAFWQAGRRSIVLCGIETHVCVLQSAFDLLAGGWDVHVVIDAVGSRNSMDHLAALDRMRQAGVKLVTCEMVLFEWCETSTHPSFRAISQLVKEG